MCGIAGWVGSSPERPDVPEKILQALKHRGPDAQGIRQWRDATLLHARLSILDLSPTGAQPMANEDDSIWVVLNGEIYNYEELRGDLIKKGHKFRGRSDTEVITHLYEEYGTSFLAHLRGMFALGLWDVQKKQMIIARDRFGIKPLFFAYTGNRLAFASEIRALLCMPDLDRRPNHQAISDYAALFYIPAPLTFYTGISSLQPCEALIAEWDADKIRWHT
ncbi:MAG: asparagine synthetase B, partial [Methylococcales bacterium]|nr:asparagine synthetase B [Methylococcales bacterium]